MSPLIIELRDQKTIFRPGEEINGAAYWKFEQTPESVVLRFFWLTQGKGSEDVQVFANFDFPNPQPEEARPFQFRAPDSPYSFSGKLVSLVWGLELVAQPGGISTKVTLTISPTGREIVLPAETPSNAIKGTKKWRFQLGSAANS